MGWGVRDGRGEAGGMPGEAARRGLGRERRGGVSRRPREWRRRAALTAAARRRLRRGSGAAGDAEEAEEEGAEGAEEGTAESTSMERGAEGGGGGGEAGGPSRRQAAGSGEAGRLFSSSSSDSSSSVFVCEQGGLSEAGGRGRLERAAAQRFRFPRPSNRTFLRRMRVRKVRRGYEKGRAGGGRGGRRRGPRPAGMGARGSGRAGPAASAPHGATGARPGDLRRRAGRRWGCWVPRGAAVGRARRWRRTAAGPSKVARS